jgi:hypothetical protein
MEDESHERDEEGLGHVEEDEEGREPGRLEAR